MYEIIINPASRSGRGQEYWNRLKPYLEEQQIPFRAHMSDYSGHIAQIMHELTKDLSDDSAVLSVIVLGGDGTVNEALQGISRFDKVALSYIPTGSSNDFARDLGISKDPIEALEQILHNPTRKRIDIGSVEYKDCRKPDPEKEKRYFAVSCGIGYDAAICQEAMHSKIKQVLNRCGLGKLTYLIVALKQLACAKSISAKFTIGDNEPIKLRKLLFLSGMNHQYEGGGFMFAPGADDQDGLLDLCCVAGVSKLKVLCVLPTAYRGKHFGFKGVDDYHTTEYRLKTSAPMWLHTDGEIPALTDNIHVICLKEILEIVF